MNRGYFVSRPIEVRFHEGYRISETGCWDWCKSRRSTGVGALRESGTRRNLDAPRVSYQLHKGEIPSGMFVCHTCDNPACVNPDHLFLGSAQDNVTDRDMKGRQARGEGHARAKLTSRQVAEILQSNKSNPSLATVYGVSRTAIYLIRRGDNWKHIDIRKEESNVS